MRRIPYAFQPATIKRGYHLLRNVKMRGHAPSQNAAEALFFADEVEEGQEARIMDRGHGTGGATIYCELASSLNPRKGHLVLKVLCQND